jgi:hypothetical protein
LANDDDIIARALVRLRKGHNATDRNVQSTLGRVHKLLVMLVERIGRMEEDIGTHEGMLRHADA